MARKILTGDKELERTLKTLADKAADRVAKGTLGAGLTVIAREMKRDAPVGKTGHLKSEIGKRNERNKRKGLYEAKAGIGVGKRKKPKSQKGQTQRIAGAPHGHLVGLGTKPRTRKKLGGRFAYIKNPTSQQLSTGTMPANPFVKRAYHAARSSAETAMQKRAAKALAREAAKARSK